MHPSMSSPEEQARIELVNIARKDMQARRVFSETCRRDRFCVTCRRAFCSHCCGLHHHVDDGGGRNHHVVRVDLDAGGRPVLPALATSTSTALAPEVADVMAAQDYASRLPRDAYCLHCMRAFCAADGGCSHHDDDHHDVRIPDAVIRVEEHGGRLCVRCRGDEWWFPHLEAALGDQVHEDEDEKDGLLLLPVIRSEPGMCMICGGLVPGKPCAAFVHSDFCSPACLEKHLWDMVRRRRERLEAKQGTAAARQQLAN